MKVPVGMCRTGTFLHEAKHTSCGEEHPGMCMDFVSNEELCSSLRLPNERDRGGGGGGGGWGGLIIF